MWNLIRLKSFVRRKEKKALYGKGSMNKMRRQPTGWKKVFSPGKGMIQTCTHSLIF